MLRRTFYIYTSDMEDKIIVRRATEADCTLIRSLAERIFPCTYRGIITDEQIAYMMEWMYAPENIRRQMEEGHVYHIVLRDGDPAGYVSVRPDGADCFHLEKIYVLPECQKTGCGSVLFRAAVDYVKRQHPSPCALELNVNRHNPALGFYRRMVMRIHREGDFPIGKGFFMNDYIMRMEL